MLLRRSLRVSRSSPASNLRRYAVSTAADRARRIAIIGSGQIGLSFAALHLTRNPLCVVKIHDPRLDLADYIDQKLPGYLPPDADGKPLRDRLEISRTLEEAVKDANVVQEQGPETRAFKTALWPQVEAAARRDALLWSSTSGIPASVQSAGMRDRGRVMVVHPFNPPHLMPLLEVVPAPDTHPKLVDLTLEYWHCLGRTPVVVHKECTGFVANRLAFALFREAASLVRKGVIGVADLDAVVTASLGPRFAVAGPFKSYHAGGGGADGMATFLDKIGGTVQECWDASEADMKGGEIAVGNPWQEEVAHQCKEAFGVVDTAERDRRLRKVLDAMAEK